MKKKGFTLIEMLAVIIIFGVIIGLGVAAYSKYITGSRNKSYNIAEASMKTAAIDAIADCITGEGKDRAFCQNHDLVENQYEYELVYLNELVNDDYMDEIRDPYNTDLLCDSDKSYVYITNKADTNEVNNADFNYEVCLVCSNYKSKACLDNVEDTNRDYNAYCKVSYDEAGLIPYNGEWTDKDLYLTLTVDGEYKYGISYFTYNFGKTSKKVTALNNKIVTPLKNTVDNQTVTVTATDGLGGNSNQATCGVVKIDKEKILNAKLTGVLSSKKTQINSDDWASEDVLLTVTTNPKKIPSGSLYQWYKDGEKVGEETTNNTYVASEDGIYYATVTNSLRNQTVKTNEFKVKIDREPPTIKAKSNPISLGSQDYSFINNVTYTFSISEGTVTCNPASSKKTGTYNVTCTATGGNKLTASVTFSARHSYPATYISKTCTGSRLLGCHSEKYCTDQYDCDPWWCPDWSLGCCAGCHQEFGKVCCDNYSEKEVCDYEYYDYECGHYTCPNGGSLSGSTCNY